MIAQSGKKICSILDNLLEGKEYGGGAYCVAFTSPESIAAFAQVLY